MRVILATDGSGAAEIAIGLAHNVIWPAGTEIRVVCVCPPQEPLLAADWAIPADFDGDSYKAEAEISAQGILDAAVRRLEPAQAKVSQQIMHGRPATKVVEAARNFKADLIIVGSRGHGTIASMLLGSVSAEIADHAPCPVLVARTTGLSRTVLGVDGSSFAREAEEVLATWPIFGDADIDVTSVAGIPLAAAWAIGAYVPSEQAVDEATLGISEHTRMCREALGRLHTAGRGASARVVQGDAATELIRAARETDADVIVVGTHGRSGLSRAVFGSVARNVMLHAPCSVLVVRGLNASAAAPA